MSLSWPIVMLFGAVVVSGACYLLQRRRGPDRAARPVPGTLPRPGEALVRARRAGGCCGAVLFCIAVYAAVWVLMVIAAVVVDTLGATEPNPPGYLVLLVIVYFSLVIWPFYAATHWLAYVVIAAGLVAPFVMAGWLGARGLRPLWAGLVGGLMLVVLPPLAGLLSRAAGWWELPAWR